MADLFQKPVDVFHVGPQKSGTTWMYEALREHPDVNTPRMHSVHFFDLHYVRGVDWYHEQFDQGAGRLSYDPTPTYIRDPFVPERIARYNPEATILITARNPVERAFSHYWHEKKKDRFNFEFPEIFENYDLYCSWVEPGLYAHHIRRFQEHFPRERIHVLFLDDLESSPVDFFASTCALLGIDPVFEPSVLDRRVNEAVGYRSQRFRQLDASLAGRPGVSRLLGRAYDGLFGQEMESLGSVSRDVKEQLLALFASDIEALERETGRDLSAWKTIPQ